MVVAQGNPLGIRGVADLDGDRLAWRAPGTASRLLLERLLLEAGIDLRPGCERPSTHISGSRPPLGPGLPTPGWRFARSPTPRNSSGYPWSPSRSSWRCALTSGRRPRRCSTHWRARRCTSGFRSCGLRPHRERTNEEGGLTRGEVILIAALATAVLGLAGCGGDGAGERAADCHRRRDDDPGDDDQHAGLRAARRDPVPAFEQGSDCGQDRRGRDPGRRIEMGEAATPTSCWCTRRRPRRSSWPSGHGSSREPVMHNDFVVVGPPDDPARVARRRRRRRRR